MLRPLRLAASLLCVLLFWSGNASAREDRSREGLNKDKVLQLFRLLRPRNTRTLARLDSFSQLDLRALRQQGTPLAGLVLDVDETLAPHHGKIPEATLRQIAELRREGVKVAIFSNAKADVNPARQADLARLEAMGAKIMGGAIVAKPSTSGFIQAAAALGLPRRAVAMVGDNYLTDGGAIRAGLHFIKVRPVKTPKMGLERLPQRSLRALTSGIARLHAFFRRR